jgi:hypothetical protein
MYKVTIVCRKGKHQPIEMYINGTEMMVRLSKEMGIKEEEWLEKLPHTHLDGNSINIIEECDMELVPSKIPVS